MWKSSGRDRPPFPLPLNYSVPEEVGNRDERRPDGDQKKGARNEIRENHESQPAGQRDDRTLLLPIYEEAEPDGAEDHAPEERRGRHRARRFTAYPYGIGQAGSSPSSCCALSAQ